MTDKQLTKNQLELLKQVNNNDNPTTKQIYEKEPVKNEYSERKAVYNSLEILKDDYDLVKSAKKGREVVWQLTQKGQRKLKKQINQENKKVEKDVELFDRSNGVQVFTQYFEEELKDQVTKLELGKESLIIDFQDLEKFDAWLADELLDNPKEVLETAETALTRLGFVTVEDADIRVENVSEIDTTPISQLSSKDIGKLVSIEGVLQSAGSTKMSLSGAEFECNDCGQLFKRSADPGEDLRAPYKCADCGSDDFDVVDRKFRTVRNLRVKEAPDKRGNDSVNVVVEGQLADDKSKSLHTTGSGVKITGYLEPFKRNKNDDYYDIRLHANNVEILDDKWDETEISSEDLERIREIGDRDDTVDLLVESFAAEEIAHLDLLKETMLVWLLGKNTDASGSGFDLGNVNVLVIGEPGTGKTHLARYVEENFPRTLGTVGTGATGVGLTATVRRDELTGDFVAEAGQLPMAHQGFHITDEFDKIDSEDAVNMNEALSNGTISLSKANIQTRLNADVSELSMGNPRSDLFDPYEPIYTQLPIPEEQESLKDRYDIKMAVERGDWGSEDDRRKELGKIQTIVERNTGKEVDIPALEEVEQDSSNDLEPLDEEIFVKYVVHAQNLDPEFSEDVLDKLVQIYSDIKDLEADSDGDEKKNLWDVRRFESLMKIAKAFARADLCEEVEESHVRRANNLVRRTLDSIGFQLGVDDLDEMKSQGRKQRQEIAEVKDIVGELADQGSEREGVDKQDVVEAADFSESRVEDVIDTLKKKGELYEPEPGRIAKI